MKLRLFIVECMLLCAAIAYACGPYYNDISYPLTYHFYLKKGDPVLSGIQYESNISSWQRITSSSIPSDDIAEIIYGISLNSIKKEFTGKSDNAFVNWIKSNSATYLRDYIYLAKKVEVIRVLINNPWYYPNSKSGEVRPDDVEGCLNELLALCKANMNKPLSDRYALQAIRILRALNKPADGIQFYTKAFSGLSDKNLMKQMAQGYVAGFYMNLGDTIKANEMFALAGDFNSLSSPTTENISRLAYYHPESDVLKYRLNGFIGYEFRNRNIRLLKVADAALRSPKVVHRGDWIYLKAFVEGVYNNNWQKAEHLAKQSLANKFSDKRMAKDARFFKICAGAKNGNLMSIDDDFSWMLDNYPNYRQGLLFFVIPGLIAKNRIDEALLVVNTMDIDAPYASTGFQMLMSSNPEDVIRYKQKLASAKGVFGKLKNKVRHDDDYLNDIIGTLYLRKGQYAAATKYLKKVSEQYQRSTNIFKGGYLIYNPWDYAYVPVSKWEYDSYSKWMYREDGLTLIPDVNVSRVAKLPTQINAKLNFATEMARLQKEMLSSGNTDAKNIARLRYAIGRYNSFNTCWALTQYWFGTTTQCNYQPFYYGEDDEIIDLKYIIDTPKEMADIEDWFVKEVTGVLDSLKTDAAKATANMMLRNYRTIAKYYPDSSEGKYLATHCDRWSDWL